MSDNVTAPINHGLAAGFAVNYTPVVKAPATALTARGNGQT
jgi:hypothetical protein